MVGGSKKPCIKASRAGPEAESRLLVALVLGYDIAPSIMRDTVTVSMLYSNSYPFRLSTTYVAC